MHRTLGAVIVARGPISNLCETLTIDNLQLNQIHEIYYLFRSSASYVLIKRETAKKQCTMQCILIIMFSCLSQDSDRYRIRMTLNTFLSTDFGGRVERGKCLLVETWIF